MKYFWLFICFNFYSFSYLDAQIIKSFAGGYGYGNALNAELNKPAGIYLDNAGNLFICDAGNNIIRKVNSSGIISIVAGNGCTDYTGNNAPALQCGLYQPTGIFGDQHHNLYICDFAHSVVEKIDSSGFMHNLAGNDSPGYSGDNALATLAQLYNPSSLAMDDTGNIYIADEVNNRIRKIRVSTGIISTIAGSGLAGYSGDNGPALAAKFRDPYSIAIDHSGNIYVADLFNNAIRKINSAGTISTIAGTGAAGYTGDGAAATAATLFNPTAVALDDSGNLYIADNQNNAIRKVNTSGIISTIAGTGIAGFSGEGALAKNAMLNKPVSVICDHTGTIFISDQFNNRIRKVDTSGVISTYAGPGYFSGDGGQALEATLYRPHGVACKNGIIYIADAYNSRIRKVDTNGMITTIAGTGVPGYSGNNGLALNAKLYLPSILCVDALDNIYFVDTNHVVRKIGNNGIITTLAGIGVGGYSGDTGPAVLARLNQPNGIAVDLQGNVYISDHLNKRIRVVDTLGVIKTFAGNGTVGFNGDSILASTAIIGEPMGVSCDDSGNVYIADQYNYKVRKVFAHGPLAGKIVTIAGNGICGYTGDDGNALQAEVIPQGISADAMGNVFIIDQFTGRIRKVDTNGIITHLAGTSSEDFGICGDGGIDSLADLNNPTQVAINDKGKIFIADEFLNRIREINYIPGLAMPVFNKATFNDILLYPNPAQNECTLLFQHYIVSAEAYIYTIQGEIVLTEQFARTNSNKLTIDLKNLPEGNYFIKLISDGMVYFKKLTIIK